MRARMEGRRRTRRKRTPFQEPAGAVNPSLLPSRIKLRLLQCQHTRSAWLGYRYLSLRTLSYLSWTLCTMENVMYLSLAHLSESTCSYAPYVPRNFLCLQEKIAELEESAMGAKNWQLTGEVDAARRPLNSALGVDMDFETTGV